MGLDMYAKTTDKEIPDVDFGCPDSKDLFYWRKHPNLHGWMEKLYRRKGGQKESFNCAAVKLIAEDLNELEKDVLAEELPETTGFFFGKSFPEDRDRDLEFIKEARRALNEGLSVYYTSWW